MGLITHSWGGHDLRFNRGIAGGECAKMIRQKKVDSFANNARKKNAVVCALRHADHGKNGAELTEKITLVTMEQNVSRSRSSHFVMAERLCCLKRLQAGKVTIKTDTNLASVKSQNKTEQNKHNITEQNRTETA